MGGEGWVRRLLSLRALHCGRLVGQSIERFRSATQRPDARFGAWQSGQILAHSISLFLSSLVPPERFSQPHNDFAFPFVSLAVRIGTINDTDDLFFSSPIRLSVPIRHDLHTVDFASQIMQHNKAAKFILWKFTQANRARLSIYPHLTQATDTSNVRLFSCSLVLCTFGSTLFGVSEVR